MFRCTADSDWMPDAWIIERLRREERERERQRPALRIEAPSALPPDAPDEVEGERGGTVIIIDL